MSPLRLNRVFLTAAAAVLAATSARATTMDTVPVGNPGNVADTEVMTDGTTGYGAVDYHYSIGTYEVTTAQYVEFLNAVAAIDTYGVYNTMMWSDPHGHGCRIGRSGSSGSYTYSVASSRANRPVNYVSWYSAARFCNWLTAGDTESGVYTFTNGSLTGILDHESAADALGKTAWFIPTEDEWYKAAYHKNDGATGNYWDYPTGTNSTPSNDLINPDPGNNANFHEWYEDYTVGRPYYTTEVGAFTNSQSAYGTFDQGGNLCEWNEDLIDGTDEEWRSRRGGYWSTFPQSLGASRRSYGDPRYGDRTMGFRVANIPEPGCLGLLVGIVLTTLLRRGLKK